MHIDRLFVLDIFDCPAYPPSCLFNVADCLEFFGSAGFASSACVFLLYMGEQNIVPFLTNYVGLFALTSIVPRGEINVERGGR